MEELKPCPFCGESESEIIEIENINFVARCGYCSARGEECSLKQGAIKAWNTRTPDKSLIEKLADEKEIAKYLSLTFLASGIKISGVRIKNLATAIATYIKKRGGVK